MFSAQQGCSREDDDLAQEPTMESVLRMIRELCTRNAQPEEEDRRPEAEASRQEARQKPKPSRK